MRTGGLVDLQANGYAGVDFNDEGVTPAAIDHALAAMLRAGVCHVLPTLISAAAETLAARLAALDRAVAGSRLGRLMVPGFHLEGPFLSPLPGYAGCHPPAAMIAPDLALLDRLQAQAERPILLLTLAPELPGAIGFIRAATARGVAVAIGHTAADRDTIGAAAAAGAVLSTHLGNALPQPLPKFDNPLMAQLAEDRLMASVIADGLHIPPHALAVMARAKDARRLVLVTDATAAAAAAPGTYRLAGMAIERPADGSVRLAGTERLAGSALTLDQAVRNLVAWDIASAGVALACARDRPLAVLAGALARSGVTLAPSAVDWSDGLHPLRVELDGMACAA
jgi:N-acetylglucosamine-6-phosphate deacetylase